MNREGARTGAAEPALAPTLEDAFVQLTQVDAEAMRNGGPQRAGEGAR